MLSIGELRGRRFATLAEFVLWGRGGLYRAWPREGTLARHLAMAAIDLTFLGISDVKVVVFETAKGHPRQPSRANLERLDHVPCVVEDDDAHALHRDLEAALAVKHEGAWCAILEVGQRLLVFQILTSVIEIEGYDSVLTGFADKECAGILRPDHPCG